MPEGCHVTLTLFGYDTLPGRLWAFSQMGLAKPAIRDLGGLTFFKLMGTGGGAGFSTRPDLSTYTLLCVWTDEASAYRALGQSQVFRRFGQHASRIATVHLQPTRSCGAWAGQAPFRVADDVKASGPVVALTRAALSYRTLGAFWSRVPAISDEAEHDGARHFMKGMGEAPLVNQVTFSIWESEEAMHRFAKESATHGEAVKMAWANGWFREYLFARFNLIAIDGAWPGLEAFAGLCPHAPSGMADLRSGAKAA